MTTRPLIVLAIASILVVAATTTVDAADSVSSIDLVEHPDRYDGTRVVFEGEVVSGPLSRGNRAWIHVNDDAYARGETGLAGYNSGQAIWLDAGLIAPIENWGDYDTRGDLVRVQGVFHAADPEHGGDMDIHASELEVLERGGSIAHPAKWWKLWASVALLGLAAGGRALRQRRLQTTPLSSTR